MLNNLKSKTISFPIQEYKEYGMELPIKFKIEDILDYALGGFSALLATSELIPIIEIIPSWQNPNIIFIYKLSDFEIQNIENLSSTKEKKLQKPQKYKQAIDFTFNNQEIEGFITIETLYKKEQNFFEIKFKLEFNNDKYIANEILLYEKEELYRLINERTTEMYNGLRNALFPKKGNLRKDNSSPYLSFATAPIMQEIRRIMINKEDPEKSLIELKTKNGEYQIEFPDFLNLSSDLTVDIFNGLVHLWLSKETSGESAVIDVDELLFIKNLKKNPSSGRRGGYKEAQREQIKEQLELLSKIRVSAINMPVPELKKNGERALENINISSPLLFIDKTLEENRYKICPGEILKKTLTGAGKMTGLLHKKIAQLDYKKYYWEKRIGNYLAWIWRNRKNKCALLSPISVYSILKEVVKEVEATRPNRIRIRLENALYKLEELGIIRDWQYKNLNEEELSNKGWFNKWVNHQLIIEPPKEILDEYNKGNKKRHSNLIETTRYSQTAIAEELKIPTHKITKYMNGDKKMNKKQKEKLEKFMWQ